MGRDRIISLLSIGKKTSKGSHTLSFIKLQKNQLNGPVLMGSNKMQLLLPYHLKLGEILLSRIQEEYKVELET